MKKIFTIALICIIPSFLMSSDISQTDIVPRTVNFIIFAAFLYYILADKIKQVFIQRTNGIQSQLDELQEKVDESKRNLQDAKNELDEAKKISSEITQMANRDIDIIKKSVKNEVDQDIISLNKNFEKKISNEERRAKKDVVNEWMEQFLNSDVLNLQKEELTKIILKKVA